MTEKAEHLTVFLTVPERKQESPLPDAVEQSEVGDLKALCEATLEQYRARPIHLSAAQSAALLPLLSVMVEDLSGAMTPCDAAHPIVVFIDLPEAQRPTDPLPAEVRLSGGLARAVVVLIEESLTGTREAADAAEAAGHSSPIDDA